MSCQGLTNTTQEFPDIVHRLKLSVVALVAIIGAVGLRLPVETVLKIILRLNY